METEGWNPGGGGGGGGGGGRRLYKPNKNNGFNESMIPAKRRLVKRMVFDSILNFIASLFNIASHNP